MIADLLFLQEPAPVGRKKPGPVEVQAGPFANFLDKSVASFMQKYIVPLCIARYGLSFPKELSLESVQEMLIVIIDAEQLMPGYPDCAAEAKKYSVAFKDFALRVKAAAGMYTAFADQPNQEPHHPLAIGYEIPRPQVQRRQADPPLRPLATSTRSFAIASQILLLTPATPVPSKMRP
jgi:hypothetical protein